MGTLGLDVLMFMVVQIETYYGITAVTLVLATCDVHASKKDCCPLISDKRKLVHVENSIARLPHLCRAKISCLHHGTHSQHIGAGLSYQLDTTRRHRASDGLIKDTRCIRWFCALQEHTNANCGMLGHYQA